MVLLTALSFVHRDLAADTILCFADPAVEDTVALFIVLREDVAESACGRGTGPVVGVFLKGFLEEFVEVSGNC